MVRKAMIDSPGGSKEEGTQGRKVLEKRYSKTKVV